MRRGGIVGALRNCCFDSLVSISGVLRNVSLERHSGLSGLSNHQQDHPWLMGNEVDILPHLLLPLAGPEELDEDVRGELDSWKHLMTLLT